MPVIGGTTEIIQKIPTQHTGKKRSQGTTEDSQHGT